jgi:hypothetical protein
MTCIPLFHLDLFVQKVECCTTFPSEKAETDTTWHHSKIQIILEKPRKATRWVNHPGKSESNFDRFFNAFTGWMKRVYKK